MALSKVKKSADSYRLHRNFHYDSSMHILFGLRSINPDGEHVNRWFNSSRQRDDTLEGLLKEPEGVGLVYYKLLRIDEEVFVSETGWKAK